MSTARWGLGLLLLAACSGGGSTGATADTRLVVTGGDLGPQTEFLTLVRGGAPVHGAKVTINGTALSETSSGQYSGTLPAVLGTGSAVNLMVVDGTDTVTGTASIPAAPTVTSPALNATFQQDSPIPFTWTSATNPDRFVAAIETTDGVAVVDSLTGIVRSATIVTTNLSVDVTSVIGFVVAYQDGSFAGDAHPASRMNVRQISQQVPLQLMPR